jgi:putative ABC transport system permease protein
VSAALRDPGIATDAGGAFVRRRIHIPYINRPLLLSISNAFRKRQRMLLTLLSLALGGAVFLGADNLRNSVRESVDLLFSSQRYDIVLNLKDSYPAAKSEAIAATVTGVERAQAIANVNASVMHDGGMFGNAFKIVGLPPDSPMIVESVEQGRWLNASDDNSLVISRALLKDEPTLVPGADISLMINGEAKRWRIVGIDPNIQPLAYAPRTTLITLNGNDHASILLVATTGHNAAAQLEVIARLRAAFEQAGMPVANSRLMSESRRVVEDHLLMVVQFLGVMGWVMIIVGGIGLASTMSLAVLERTREIGVMRAIGARHRAIIGMIMIEGLVIAVLGWIVSIPLSIPMNIALTKAFGQVMFTVPTHFIPDLRGVLIWLLMATIVSLAACAWPARRATRIPTAIALSYE